METEELTKLVDGIYKNILDKFNPGARQMITAGKAYLKALHGAAAASRLYVDAVGKLGRQAQQGTWGGCADIGTALMKVVEVYREIQDQQMNILKAFYVDLLVPLETNLEKDTKVVQSEQKRFLQQHKLRSESYSKAAATIKKQRKKKTNVTKVGSAMDKEMKNMQILEEEKTKLDAFCEQSLKNAMTQERRRYGFVLERQCSLAKHWLAYHSAGANAYNTGLEEWLEVSRTREYLPPNVEAMFVSRMRQVSFWADEDVYASPRVGDDDDRASVGSALRKTRSVDASCLDVRSIGDLGSPAQGLSRAKSDFNLQASLHDDEPETNTRATRPSSLAPPTCTTRDPPLARALYAYAAAGDNQLSFQQGDVLALLGERTKGWQYGENLRSHQAGWFPLAYTEPVANDEMIGSSPARWSCVQTPNDGPPPAPVAHAQTTPSTPSVHQHSHPPTRMFGDTVTAHHVNKGRLGSGSPGLPPTLPAPSPSALSSSASATFHASTPASAPGNAIKNSTSSASFTTHAVIETRSFGPQTLPMRSQVTQNKVGPAKTVVSAVGNVSLHSSNDSGFSNEPPPQPDVDYSDEEAQRLRVPISKSAQQNNDRKAYMLKTQSLKRGPKPSMHPSNGYLTDDQQLILRNMFDMDKDSQKVKRTKSFWKFGRTTSEEIMEGMSLWQHRDIVDTVPEYKKKFFVKIKKELRPAPDIPDVRNPASPEKSPPLENIQSRPKETIDRKEVKVTNGIRPARSLGSIQNEENQEKARKANENFNQRSQTLNRKTMSDKSIVEEKQEEFIPRNESRHSDLTNTSTIKTNFENSFYNDESGDGFVMKTVKRREILQRYDNDSSSEVNSVASSTDPYDCIIVDDHMTSRKQQELDRRRQAQILDNDIKKRKENAYMPEFEEIEVTPIRPHVRATLSSEKVKKPSHERSPGKTMEFKTFKDNSKEIKTFSASSETLKYKDDQPTDRYGIPTECNNNEIRNDNTYNGHDDGTLKYKKRSSNEEKNRQQNIMENGKNKKEYPQAEARLPKKDIKSYENKEPRIDYSLDRRHMKREFSETKNRTDPRTRNRGNRSYDDSTLPYNGRREDRYYEANISYFSDQERRVSRYDYETDSKKAEKSKLRQEEAKLEARRFIERRNEGPYSESDDQKFNEALKQQRPQLLPRTKLLKRPVEGNDLPEEGHTFGPWYDLWGRETVVYK